MRIYAKISHRIWSCHFFFYQSKIINNVPKIIFDLALGHLSLIARSRVVSIRKPAILIIVHFV